MAQNSRPTPKDLRYLARLASRYIWTAYNMMNGNYLALATVIAVVLLSFLIPDISQKIHATSELKNMKKVLNVMTVVLATVVAVVLLSFLIPDFSHKLHPTSELKSMKKKKSAMAKEVNHAEVACLTAADEICYLHCSMQDDATETARNLQDLSVCTSHCVRPTMSEPVQVERRIGFFKRIFFPNRNASHKEITIMSYVYTDSFDAQKTINLPDEYDVMPSQSAGVFTDQ